MNQREWLQHLSWNSIRNSVSKFFNHWEWNVALPLSLFCLSEPNDSLNQVSKYLLQLCNQSKILFFIHTSLIIQQSIQVWGTTEVQWNLLGWSPDTASCKTSKQRVPIDYTFPQKSRHLHDTFVTATLQMQKTTIILQWIQQPAHLFRFSVYMNLVTQTYVYKGEKTDRGQ